jgi:phosphate transport system protein
MDKKHLSEHISSQFNDEIESIRERVLAMGGLVEEQLANAVTALVDSKGELGQEVAKADYRVNAAEVSIDEECNLILARRQPAATDLRLIVAIIKTITDLERIGDEAKKIAKMAVKLSEQDRPATGYREVAHLGEAVSRSLNGALDAFARMDAKAAVEVVQRDMEIDREYEAVMRQCITFMMEDPRTIKRVMDLVWAVRSMERVGDHAANLAEYVIYLVEGKDVRHIKAEELSDKLFD